MPHEDTVFTEPAFPLRVGDDFTCEFPAASRSATECGINMTRAGAALLAFINRSRRTVTDLGPTASQILAIVEGAGQPLPPHLIAERLLVTSGTMTSLLDTLERRGMVRRLPHPEDRRKLLIDITPEARALLDAMLPRVHATLREAFAPLDEEERETLIALLGRIQSRLNELAAETLDFTLDQRITPVRQYSEERDRDRTGMMETRGL